MRLDGIGPHLRAPCLAFCLWQAGQPSAKALRARSVIGSGEWGGSMLTANLLAKLHPLPKPDLMPLSSRHIAQATFSAARSSCSDVSPRQPVQ
eukprot:COSAG06_NODE_12009_length_1436_cov_0.643231_2_plen_93_part_00